MSQKQAPYKSNEQETRDGLDMFWNEKPRELPSTLSGFTPAPDELIKKCGYITALVWGKVWRYCQMSDGVCRAKLDTVAAELGMSMRNVIRVIKQLCTDGYLKDLTPNLRNKPHIYADTGKIRIRVSVEATNSTMTQSHSAMTLSHSQSDSESHEESIKKQFKKKDSSTSGAAPQKNIFQVYEQNISPLTPMIADALQDAEKTYPEEWLFDVIRLAVENNKRSWRYCETILKRWQIEGKDDGKKPTRANGTHKTVADSWLERKERELSNVRT